MKSTIPFFAFGFIFCFHTSSQGSVWQREVPDSTGTDKGMYCSLALDSGGNPHIAYYDWDFGDLRYAFYRNGRWNVVVVDSMENAGEYCSIALDSQDRPHISYQAEILEYYHALKYATLTDTGWCKVIVDSSTQEGSEFGGYSSIVIRDDGYPSISYTQQYPTKVKYAFQDRNGWHILDVAKVYSSYFTELILRDGNIPIVGFQDRDSLASLYFLRFAELNPVDSTWSLVTLPDTTTHHQSFGSTIGFDIDSQGNLYFAYEGENDSVRLAVYDGFSWNIETIPGDMGAPVAPGLSLKIDHIDRPSLALFTSSIEFWRKDDGGWSYSMVDDWVRPGTYVSLQLDRDDLPRIAVYGHTPTYSRYALFYYRYWPGDPGIVLPQTFHNYGTVWTQSFSDWNCPVENHGTAPLIIDELQFTSPWYDTAFQVVNTPIPMTILPQESDSIIIRFKPVEEQTYFDTLILFTNDSLHLEERVALQGIGTTSGDTGSLTVYVKDCFAALEYHLLNENLPLAGAQVSLYRDGQLMYGPIETGLDGSVLQDNVAVGNYDLRITKEVFIPEEGLDTLGYTTSIEIGPGANSKTVVLPESLVVQKYQSVFDLTHIEKGSLLGTYLDTFTYPSEEEVKNLIDSWKMNLHPNAKMSVARLFLAEQMVSQMFDSGYSIGGMVIRSISELVNFILYSDTWLDSILEILEFLWHLYTDQVAALMDILNAYMKYQLLSLMDEAIQQAAAELPCFGDPYLGGGICGEEVVMAAWEDIKGHYSGWRAILPGFSSDAWDKMEELIQNKLKDTLFQIVYINLLTDRQIEKAKGYSENFQFSGEFKDASESTAEFIADKTDEVEGTYSVCDGLIVSAKLFEGTAELLYLVGEIPIPGLGFLDAVGDALKIAAYVEVVSALGLSAYTFFTLPDYMDDAVDNIYFPTGLRKRFKRVPYPFPRAKSDPKLIAAIKRNLQKSVEDFDSTLVEIENHIVSGEIEDALLDLENLMISENNLRNALKVSCAPIYAVASIAKDSLEGFSEMYDSLIVSYATSGMERLKDYIYVMFLPSDTSQAMKDTVVAQLERSIHSNRVLTDRVITTLDTVSTLPMPPIVVVKEGSQDVYELSSGKTATIQVRLQNVGALAAESVSVVLKTSPAIQVNETDSIYVGRLLPGEESDVYTWTVSLLSHGYSRGSWTAEIRSTNAKTYSYSGSFETPMTPGTGGKLSNENVYSYPNPFNPDREYANLRYSLEKSAQVTIKIYDAGGNLVRTVIDNEHQIAGKEQEVFWDGRNGNGDLVANGIYFFVIETSQGERAVGKIAVLR